MADLTALKELRNKVAAGTLEFPTVIPWLPANDWLGRAYYGSLDAAKALHEALLPGWDWSVDSYAGNDCNARSCLFYPKSAGGSGQEKPILSSSETPARAWLLAILAALIAKEQADE